MNIVIKLNELGVIPFTMYFSLVASGLSFSIPLTTSVAAGFQNTSLVGSPTNKSDSSPHSPLANPYLLYLAGDALLLYGLHWASTCIDLDVAGVFLPSLHSQIVCGAVIITRLRSRFYVRLPLRPLLLHGLQVTWKLLCITRTT
jgi:hypothetical protein